MTMTAIPWPDMRWLNPPERAAIVGGRLEVVTRTETDFWRSTSYGFVHDEGHFLGREVDDEVALEVTFRGEFSRPFDQAGLMLRATPEVWIKAGVEFSDGILFASSVVTLGHSDWAVTSLPPGAGGLPLTIRASRRGDAVTLRYRVGDETSMRLLRVAYLPPNLRLQGGPMCCSPTRGGLVVTFDLPRIGPPDAQLHDE